MPATHIDISTPRGQFGARTAGERGNPLVLLLHGFPDNATTFDDLLDRLAARGMWAVAPYCRGYAPSPLLNPDGSKFGKDLLNVLAQDALAIADALAPDQPLRIVGHDNGAFTVYHALTLAPERFVRAVTLTAGNPNAVFKNTMRSPRQMWKTRYAFFFLIPGFSDNYAQRNNFAYLEYLWRTWSSGWMPPQAHLDDVKRTLAASWPSPLLHYRSGGLSGGAELPPITTPTLYLIGAEDGCVLPETANGQEHFFSGEFQSEIIPGAGHFLHLQQPDVVGEKIVNWVVQ